MIDGGFSQCVFVGWVSNPIAAETTQRVMTRRRIGVEDASYSYFNRRNVVASLARAEGGHVDSAIDSAVGAGDRRQILLAV